MLLALTGYETLLLVVALVFVTFALVVALVIPRSRPDFPGKRLGLFIGICVLLFAAQMGALLALVEFGHAESAEPATEEEAEQEPEGDVVAGKEVFLGASACGSCHTLSDAGTTGAIGPNLDATKPGHLLVVDRVTNGQGGMPAFADTLSAEQIQDVAAYVVSTQSG
ncbi:MAG TPA: cytochrome c [Gaiellaceae bacterium]|nr:cytochrome c [Gaiellaceae bacterium]